MAVVSENSVLDNKSSQVYGYSLTHKQQIWFHFIIPGISSLIIYILNFGLDIGVAIDLLSEKKLHYGLLTIVIMYFPAFIFYLRQLIKVNEEPKTACWFLKETGCFIIFPSRIVRSLGVQFFWIVEILRNIGNENEEQSLQGYENSFTESVHTYFFLKLFLQNIPQALLQIYMINTGVSSYDETDVIQAFCSLISLAVAAIGVTKLHRYESQCIGGRKRIWKSTKKNGNIESLTPQENPLLPQQETTTAGFMLPVRKPRIKAMEEDNPAVSTLAEDIALTILWYIWGNWNGWWHNYIIYVDINSHFLTLIFFAIYLAFFKPKVKYIKTDKVLTQTPTPSVRSSAV